MTFDPSQLASPFLGEEAWQRPALYDVQLEACLQSQFSARMREPLKV